jgi:polyisoprenyl-phosphate glycosyltransferase
MLRREAVSRAKAVHAVRYSVVIPIYNEVEVLPTLYDRLTHVMSGLGEPYEIIFVNDGSSDPSLPLLVDLQAKAALFYRALRHLTATEMPLDVGDFRLMSRSAIEALKSIRERNRFIRGLAGWIGFRQTSVSFIRDSRYAGETKFPLRKMLRFALTGIISFSLIPLHVAGYFGLLVSFVSFIYMVYAIGLKLFTGSTALGWASVMVAVLFLGGVQLLSLGIIGEYIGRIYEEVKQRPLYIVDETRGFERNSLTEQ